MSQNYKAKNEETEKNNKEYSNENDEKIEKTGQSDLCTSKENHKIYMFSIIEVSQSSTCCQ